MRYIITKHNFIHDKKAALQVNENRFVAEKCIQ